MATMLAGLKIVEPFFRTGQFDAIANVIDVFNAMSRGTILRSSRYAPGSFEKKTRWTRPSNLVQYRDPTSTSTVSDTVLQMHNQYSVKMPLRLGPVLFQGSALGIEGTSSEAFSLMLGRMVGEDKMERHLTYGVSALVAALSNNADSKYDATGKTVDYLSNINLQRGLRKMGDAAQNVIAWVTHSVPAADLLEKATEDKIVEEAGVVVYGGQPGTLNRPLIVTDNASLVIDNGSAADQYWVLGLTAGAIELDDCGADSAGHDITALEVITGQENISYRFQGESGLIISMKGFTWDTTNGGSYPNATSVGTAGYWDRVVSSPKLGPGIAIKVDAKTLS